MKRIICLLIIFILSVMLLPSGSAHVPLAPHDNTSIEAAFHIHEPTKSWAIYDEIHENHEAKYYSLEMGKGERLRISIFTPEESAFSPVLVIMGEDYPYNDTLPDHIEKPEGYGARVVAGERPTEADYEPFTPTSYYNILDFDEHVNTAQTYFLAIYEPENTGKFGLAVGYVEKFDVDEWISVPIDVVNIHVWEGQSILFILAPVLVTMVAGFALMFFPKFPYITPPENAVGFTFHLGGLLYIGSGFSIFVQMAVALSRASVGPGVIVTSIFGLIPILLGLAIFKVVPRTEEEFKKDRIIKIGLLGVLGLVFWAGLLVGPVLILFGLAISILTSYILKQAAEKNP
ncbi:MAG: hypothetical protein JSW28_01935 [Thermoplasmata archaeon]|nr:MAG: hypothetical protein JSW28_01935 [Thermoplasmata archaeon]